MSNSLIGICIIISLFTVNELPAKIILMVIAIINTIDSFKGLLDVLKRK